MSAANSGHQRRAKRVYAPKLPVDADRGIVPTHGNSPVVILDAGPDAARAVRDLSLSLRLGQCLFYEPTNSLGPRRKIGFPPPKTIQLGEQIFMKPHMNWRSHAGRRPPTLLFG